MTRLLFSWLLAAAFILPGTAAAQDDSDPFGAAEALAPPSTKATVASEVSTIAPGQSFEVAIELAHPSGWHSYFVNPGTVGMVLDPGWKLPEGFTAERVGWPVPHVSPTAGQNTFGYEGTVIHLFRVTPPETLATGTPVTIGAEPSWQICDEQNCVPEPPFGSEQTHTLSLEVATEPLVDPGQAGRFAAARGMLPLALPAGLEVRASRAPSSVVIALSPSSLVPDEPLHFFGYDQLLDAQGKPALERNEDAVRLVIPRNKEFDEPVPDRLSGILTVGDRGYEIGTEFGEIQAPPVSLGRLLAILGGMFIGGVILNLMPCVFPVIGLKIMGFVQQAGEDRRKIAMHGLLFAVGVLLSFWVLSGFLLGLREGALGGKGSQEISWGYQLQNPWMVWGLMLVMFLLALNMFGVFEIGTTATSVGGNLVRKQGAAGTFFSGILATVVATPCSAPFLGAALGATFALPAPLFMLSFTAMALGLAAPYLVLSLFPKLVGKLPRPGPWMESFKQGMSFLLFATAGFMLWVYVLQIEVASMLNVVLGLTALAAAGWIYGRWCPISRTKRTRLIGLAFVVVFAAVGLAQTKPPAKGLAWEPWSPKAVAAALDEGRPVYVDFTAAWCVTCQVNKKTAYNRTVQGLFKKHRVLLLKADNTNLDPAINAAIRELGRAAVPVNVLYVPGGEAPPRLTTELLTSGYMEDFLAKHLGDGK